MRICYHCGRVTPGKPLFCTHCGRSYNIKLCPRLHPNPRNALVCSVCGLRDLSIPQEKVPLWFKFLMILSGVIPGVSLLLISIFYAGYFVTRLFTDPSRLLLPMLYGFALGLVWLLWMHMPFALIRLLKSRRRENARK